MKDIPVSDIRTFAFAGHAGSGKTTLTDAIALKLGLNDRLGSVDAGSSLSDYTDEEKSRKFSIFAKPFSGVFKGRSGRGAGLVWIDCPGYSDFMGQVIAASRAVETGVMVVNAAAGLQVGLHNAWRCFSRRNMPRAFVVTGLDRDNTDFARTVKELQETFGPKCVPVVIPLKGASGVADVVATKDIPADVKDLADEARGKLVEYAAETNDALLEKYLGGEELSPDELSNGLRAAVRDGKLIPIFTCLPLKGIGVTELLEGVVRMFPSPAEREIKDAAGNPVATGADKPLVGLVWRTVNDPFVGQLAFIRIMGGTLKADSEVNNASRSQKERIGALLVVNGKKQVTVDSVSAGEIVALAKLKGTGVGETLCAVGQNILLDKIVFPKPVMSLSVTAKTQADEDKIGSALSRVAEEDPTLKVERNAETHETLLSGLGDVQLDVTVERMKNRNNVDVVLNTPKVPYKETVTALGEGHYKHKKQTGGRGQYAEVYLKVQPKRKDDEEWFEDAIVGGVIPGNFVPAVQKGVVEGMQAGAVAGYPVVDVKVSVYDGSYHEVDSSEIAFKIASARGFKDAMSKARAVLLEPIMTVRVMVPDRYMGDINGDLNQRRGRILGMGPEEGLQVITAEVPQAELFRYAAELRSITAGQGSFEMEFNRYEVVPSNVAQKVIAAAQKAKQEEKED